MIKFICCVYVAQVSGGRYMCYTVRPKVRYGESCFVFAAFSVHSLSTTPLKGETERDSGREKEERR